MPFIYAIILILLCLPACVSAQGTEKIQFSHLTATDGLPHQQINGLAQDSTGYIWIGTRNGLGKYDGYSIRNYYHSPENPRSLSHNFVRKIFPDSRGRIWILTILGLCRYLPETDDFKAYGIAADFASITETDDGSIVCGGEGLYRIRAGSDSIERIRFDHGYVISLACDNEGRIFASTNGGIFVADRLQTDFQKLDSSLYADFITGLDAIIPLFTDSKGRIWAGRNGHGAMTIDPATGRRETITPHGTVRTIAEDRHGRMWLGTSDGIDIIDTDGSVRHICRAGASQPSLSDNSVYSILPDRDGNIWAGTFFGGINLYVPDRNIFNVPSPGYGEDELGGKVVRMMCETDDGTLWIATENGGLLQMDRKTGTTRRFTEIPQLGANIHSLYHAGGDSHMWIGTFRNGLFRYNLKNGTWRRYLPADGLGSDAIFHINTDSKGVLWVATTQGLSYYDPSSDSFIKTGDATLDNNFTYTIYPDRNANLWIGTTRHGLRRIDAHSGEITPVNVDTSPLRLNDSFVTCICEDSNGNLLVGSNNSGLQMLPTGKAPATAPDLSPLANTTICAIVPDRDGKDLWISSATGLYHRDVHTGKLTRFTTADGLPSTQMNLSSWHVSSDIPSRKHRLRLTTHGIRAPYETYSRREGDSARRQHGHTRRTRRPLWTGHHTLPSVTQHRHRVWRDNARQCSPHAFSGETRRGRLFVARYEPREAYHSVQPLPRQIYTAAARLFIIRRMGKRARQKFHFHSGATPLPLPGGLYHLSVMCIAGNIRDRARCQCPDERKTRPRRSTARERERDKDKPHQDGVLLHDVA